MNDCPQCAQPLVQDHDAHGLYRSSSNVPGTADFSLRAAQNCLRRGGERLWQEVQNQQSSAGRPCPECRQPMREVRSTVSGTPMAVDVCPHCTLLWFDTGEFERLPELPPALPTPPEPRLSEKDSERIALAEVEMLAQRQRGDSMYAPPDALWKVIPAIFGFPVEVDEQTTRIFPLATLGLAALIAIISSTVLLAAPAAVQQYCFIPAQWWRYGGFTLLARSSCTVILSTSS